MKTEQVLISEQVSVEYQMSIEEQALEEILKNLKEYYQNFKKLPTPLVIIDIYYKFRQRVAAEQNSEPKHILDLTLGDIAKVSLERDLDIARHIYAGGGSQVYDYAANRTQPRNFAALTKLILDAWTLQVQNKIKTNDLLLND